jgi:KDO2-lipid IV(A) lauroyltransferase
LQGREHLDDALTDGRGAILVTAHLGYSSLIGPILRVHGYPVSQVAAKSNHDRNRARRAKWLTTGSRFRRYVYERTRVTAETLGPEDIEADLNVRPIFQALMRNGVVLIAGDGQRSIGFASHTLLGRPYLFATGFARIAMASGAPALPAFAFEGNRTHPVRVEIHPPLHIDPGASVAENIAEFASILDEELRRAPHLWHKWASQHVWGMPVSRENDPYRPEPV